ncbi:MULTISPECIES: hypothetical protein [Streptomyces]|uniref:Uncharacterized protein n=2 Tax=Streptomyces TaxID=1883 RepID=A0A2U9NZ35_STRAS|nr:hypothetical protein [Streptomyces actuosus]AWT42610.1 hypothetical protein DMT42_09975 [Streptomyces actuosus]MBM4819824.1 hypothetical protein [Streptomyces actuosus]
MTITSPAPAPARTPADWELAERVSRHMQTHFPDTTAAASWTVARDERDNTAVVVAGPGDDPTMPGGSYGIHAYRWLCSLRDAGFTAEPRTDMEVFGRPDEQAPGGRARWLHITAWDETAIRPERSIVGLVNELCQKIGLLPQHFVQLDPSAHPPVDAAFGAAVRADTARFAYHPDGGMTVAVYQGETGYPVSTGQVPAWLREIGEAHREHASPFGTWCHLRDTADEQRRGAAS